MDAYNFDDWEEFSPEPDTAEARTIGVPEYLAMGLGVLILIGLVVFWPGGSAKETATGQLAVLSISGEFHEAEVLTAERAPCEGLPDLECITATFELNAGPEAGSTYAQEFVTSEVTPEFTEGGSVVLSRIAPNGTIESIESVPCDFDPDQACTTTMVRMANGPNKGEISTVELFPGQELGLAEGQEIMATFDFDGTVIAIAPPTMETMYRYADQQRRWFLIGLTALFIAAVVALGRWKGIAAITGLGLSVVIIILWLIPSLLEGNPALPVAMIGAAAVAYLALYVSHGVNRTSTVALLGTLAALALITLLSWATTVLAEFTGVATEEATLLLTLDGFDIGGLLIAGIVIGAAGALDDVTVTQASAIAEIRSADPTIDKLHLYKRGMSIGRAHVGSIVNTLVLAYLGAALPLTILFVLAQQSFGDVANGEVVAVEIVRALVGTIGIVAAVPLTTWMATRWPSSLRHHH
jgi:uncharacterized membrane protein